MEFTLEAMHAIGQNAALDGDAIDARDLQPAAFDRLEVFCAMDLARASTRVNRAPRQPVRKSRRRSATAGRDWTDGFGLERGPKPADESPQESAIQFLRGNSAGSDVRFSRSFNRVRTANYARSLELLDEWREFELKLPMHTKDVSGLLLALRAGMARLN
jgi:hypothetical protein